MKLSDDPSLTAAARRRLEFKRRETVARALKHEKLAKFFKLEK